MINYDMPPTLGDYLVQHPDEMKDIIDVISALLTDLSDIRGPFADFDEEHFSDFLKEDDDGHYGSLENIQRSALEVATTIAHLLNRNAQDDLKSMIQTATDRDLADPARRDAGLKRIMDHQQELAQLAKPRRIEIRRTAADVIPAAEVAA